MRAGDRIQVLPGRDFEGFRGGDRGVIRDLDQEAAAGTVAFDGRCGAPIRVALRHLELERFGAEARMSSGPSSARAGSPPSRMADDTERGSVGSRSGRPLSAVWNSGSRSPPLAALEPSSIALQEGSTHLSTISARGPLFNAGLEDVVGRMERIEGRLEAFLEQHVGAQKAQQERQQTDAKVQELVSKAVENQLVEGRLRELAEKMEATFDDQLRTKVEAVVLSRVNVSHLCEMRDLHEKVEAALSLQFGEARQRELYAHLEAKLGQEITRRTERHIQAVYDRLKTVTTEMNNQLSAIWIRFGEGSSPGLADRKFPRSGSPSPPATLAAASTLSTTFPRASDAGSSPVHSCGGGSPRLGLGGRLPQPMPSPYGQSARRGPLVAARGAQQEALSSRVDALDTLSRMVDDCTQTFGNFVREERDRSQSPPREGLQPQPRLLAAAAPPRWTAAAASP